MGERAGDWGYIHPDQTPQTPAPSPPPWIVPPPTLPLPIKRAGSWRDGAYLGVGRVRGLWEEGASGTYWGQGGVKGSVHPLSALWSIEDSQGDLKVKPCLSH